MKRPRILQLLAALAAAACLLALGFSPSEPDGDAEPSVALSIASADPDPSGAPPTGAQSTLQGNAPPPDDVVPGELLVRFEKDADRETKELARSRADAELEERLPVPGLELVSLEPGDSVQAVEERFEDQDGVLYAEPNRYRQAASTPSDPFFDRLWGLDNQGQSAAGTAGTPDADVDAPEAWSVTVGAPDLTVAVADSGVDVAHPDLAPNVWGNPRETANGRDDDGNGLVDDVRGWDWIDDDNDPADANGHGTHVAGTVMARGDDGRGVAGVSWRGRIMPLRVLDANGSGTVADLLAAYAYAARNGAKVVNLSLGSTSASRAERDAMRAAPNVLFVVAAGNSGSDNDVNPTYPCAYQLDNVVCVAATDQRDELAGFSSYGLTSVDLAAPGTDILSTLPGGRYAFFDGTSMATPHVSGAAALLWGFDPSLSLAAVRSNLLGGVDARTALAGKTVTGGRLNVVGSLARAGAAMPASVSPAPTQTPAPAAVPAPDVAGPAAPAPSPAAPAASLDTSAPRAAVRLPRAPRLGAVVQRGLVARIRCSEPCAIDVPRLVVDAGTARRLGLSRRRATLGRERGRTSSTSGAAVRLVLTARAKRRVQRVAVLPVTATATLIDRAGNRRSVAKRIHLRR